MIVCTIWCARLGQLTNSSASGASATDLFTEVMTELGNLRFSWPPSQRTRRFAALGGRVNRPR